MVFESQGPDLWRSVFERATDLVMVSDFVSGRILSLNPAGIRLVGLRDDADARARTTAEFLTDAGLAQTPAVEAALTRDGHWEGTSELRHFGTGAPIPVSVSTFTVRTGEAGPAVIAIIARDRRGRRTQDRRFRKALDEAAHRAHEQHALAELGQLAVDADLDTLLPAAAGAAATLIGVQCASIARLTDTGDALDIVAYRGQPPTPRSFAAGPATQPGYALATGDVVVCPNREHETRFATTTMAGRGLRSGISVPISDDAPWGVLTVHSARPRGYTDRDVAFLRAVAAVLSAAIGRIDTETRVRQQSNRDPLTGLPNRTAAYRQITAALHTAHRDRTPLALLLVDVDDFKVVNDSLGHAHGDAALIRLAERLVGAVRPTDTVARLGGDEFVIVCEDVGTADTAVDLATRITTALRTPDHSTGTPVPLRASIGIAVSDPTCTTEELIRRADLAMYRAKSAGAGGHALYHPGESGSYDADRVLRMSTDLRTALDRNQLTLLYQPIVDLRCGAVVAVEALVRWAHPTLGIISRTEFVAVAERTGLIGPVGSWGLRTACRQAAAWPAHDGTEVRVHVNVSTVQLRDPLFADQVADILADTGLPAHRLGLEISETASASVTARTVDTLTALHELGVVLLLDHLGTGHGPLGYLIRYPIFDSLKIDRSYITALPGPRPEAVVTAFVTIARAYGATVIGNGVQTQTQLDTLHACGCDLAQGSYLAEPAPADAIPALQADQRAGTDGPNSVPPPAH